MDPASTQGGRDADATARQALAAAAARSAARRGREALILAAIAALLGALSVAANLGDALGGSGPALGRAALGVLGVVAGVWLWRQPRRGWWLALAWALLQIPVYAWTPDGSPTLQVVSFPLAATSQVTENGRVTAYSQPRNSRASGSPLMRSWTVIRESCRARAAPSWSRSRTWQ